MTATEFSPPVRKAIIRVRSPGMARETYGANTRTDSDRLKDGWAYTGDIGVARRRRLLPVSSPAART